jgi:two-component system, OmpR family, response regulator TctD
MRTLIIEDDVALARGLAQSLRDMGFAVDHHRTGRGAAEVALSEPYSLIVLDLILPIVSGFDVLQSVRQRGSLAPIMILTVRHAVRDRVKGLNLGADDYLTKPFDLAEFEARVRALVRRSQGAPFPALKCGPLTWDRSALTVRMDGNLLDLRRREQAVLISLMTHAGKVVPKGRLMAEVFGFEEEVAPNALELYIARLRKKLGCNGPKIITIPGVGYLLETG